MGKCGQNFYFIITEKFTRIDQKFESREFFFNKESENTETENKTFSFGASYFQWVFHLGFSNM